VPIFDESARGLAQSKTLARHSILKKGEAFGLRQSSGALRR